MTMEDVERAIDICTKSGINDMDFVANVIYSQQATIDVVQRLLTKWQMNYDGLKKQFMDYMNGEK